MLCKLAVIMATKEVYCTLCSSPFSDPVSYLVYMSVVRSTCTLDVTASSGGWKIMFGYMHISRHI